ncbi:hypothetical protein AAC387_Pa06g1449 [Persea americana]
MSIRSASSKLEAPNKNLKARSSETLYVRVLGKRDLRDRRLKIGKCSEDENAYGSSARCSGFCFFFSVVDQV